MRPSEGPLVSGAKAIEHSPQEGLKIVRAVEGFPDYQAQL